MDTSTAKDVKKEEIISKEVSEIMNQQKLCLMRTIVEKQDPTSKEYDDQVFRRLLRYRKLNVDEASERFLRYLKWRKSFVPNGWISETEIPNEIAQDKVFLQGFDKKGRPIGILFFGRHFPTKGKDSHAEYKRYLVYCLDKLCARMPVGQEQFTFIGDFRGWGLPNFDVKGLQVMISILQDYFPETLAQAFLVHHPNIFKTMWKFIRPFIRSNTQKKIVFLESKMITPRLLQDIDEDQLPEIYGGKLPIVPIQDTIVAN
ncbi:Patellin-5 [Thalictrum thalictroides]|uniref:Patellin-5 n=1 Tax=Thalictrum thalictroides TaxID=46969 RepID=A0A7J6V7U1_THATH|nr:Patellin-5 [Thalictrum thalictroides]